MIEKNHLSCRAEGLSAITSAASLNAREAFCSPSAAITCALELFSNENLNCLFSRQLIVNQYVIEFIEFITHLIVGKNFFTKIDIIFLFNLLLETL